MTYRGEAFDIVLFSKIATPYGQVTSMVAVRKLEDVIESGINISFYKTAQVGA